jgi:solute:Na+ symporter, SSS family
MITRYDYFIIAFYFVFILGIGAAFRRLSKNTSDYFRCGGAMPWWITGTSAWIASFTAWTFVGAAGKVYETGTLVLWVYYASVLAYVLVYFWTCVRFRRMRVVTWMEAVRARFGTGTEQFYTWLKVPLQLLLAGVSLNAIGVFMSTVFGMNMTVVLIALGVIVTIVAFAGGAWAVLASDFVQMFLVMTITVATAVLTLMQPRIGGLSGLLAKVPSAHFHWSELERPELLFFWIGVQLWFKFSDANNIENSTMYLMAKNDRDARRMVLIPLIGSLVGPLIWFIPSMAATITHPNLAAQYPTLTQPHEAAFVAVAMDVMPQGLLGLLLCAMLGATLTSMDAGLNKNVGVFVRSLYRPLINPNASEKRQLIVSKLCTLAFGAFIILVAVEVNRLRTIGLFDLANLLAATLLMPMALPLLWGMFYKRTPGWSAWSTALVGFGVSLAAKYWVTPQQIQHLMRWSTPLSDHEQTDLLLVTATFGTVIIGTAWFFFTSLFYNAAPLVQRQRVENFFKNIRTPIDARAEGIENHDEVLYRLMGLLCIVYGAFILLLILIPNNLIGRLCFVFCGGAIEIMGLILYWRSRAKPVNPRDEVGPKLAGEIPVISLPSVAKRTGL